MPPLTPGLVALAAAAEETATATRVGSGRRRESAAGASSRPRKRRAVPPHLWCATCATRTPGEGAEARRLFAEETGGGGGGGGVTAGGGGGGGAAARVEAGCQTPAGWKAPLRPTHRNNPAYCHTWRFKRKDAVAAAVVRAAKERAREVERTARRRS